MTGALQVDRLTVDRGGRRVVTEVSFALAPGDIVTVVGPNGAGKSSLLEATLGLLPATDGWVRFDGRPLHDLQGRSRVFSYMPDEAEPPPEVRIQTLVAHAERFGRPPSRLADWLVERLGLREIIGERAGRLFPGQKRRVLLFTALCSSRPVMVLDEPLAAFDPLQLLDVLAVLRDRAASGVACSSARTR
jgi:iron complex transport system ATP-binding protein